MRRAQSYLHAEEEAVELLVSIESNWMKMETQIQFLKKVAPRMDERSHNMHSQILSQLEGKLKTATLIMDQLMAKKKSGMERSVDQEVIKYEDRNINTLIKRLGNMKPSKKFRYSQNKASLERIIVDIEKWQLRFDPAWSFAMTRLIDNIDNEIQDECKVREIKDLLIAFSMIRMAKCTN